MFAHSKSMGPSTCLRWPQSCRASPLRRLLHPLPDSHLQAKEIRHTVRLLLALLAAHLTVTRKPAPLF